MTLAGSAARPCLLGVADDEILKNTFANNAFENFQIAAYKSLLALTGPAGAMACKPLLEANLREEKAMADRIASNVERVTEALLARQAQ